MSAKESASRQPASSSKKRVTGKTPAATSRTKKSATKKAAKRKAAAKPASKSSGGKRRFPVVGIGASAGGLEALEELLGATPADTGMAFIVVSHQHPGHTSLLPELLGKCTEMSVAEAKDGDRLQPNHVYVAPPGGYVAVMDSVLHLMGGPKGEMPPLPIDFFFRALAQDQKDRAICIVLSGTGSDGTLGLKAVKGESGMAMVQEVHSARYAGMPSSAISTSLADYVMPPIAMPAQLVAYAGGMNLYGRAQHGDAASVPLDLEQPMQKIFVLLRARTGHDFSSYKPNTMRRRIERRITVHEMKSPQEYVSLLQENPHEIDILFKELLIGVTSFFRDPEAWKVLAEKALPELMAVRPENYTFRVWVPGCGSGEEAYTIAILLRECMGNVNKPFDFQIFATDLDAEAIEVARAGLYPVGIAADVPPEFLKRYFIKEDGAYRVRKEIREMLVFAQQNVIKDPPFTKLDLLSCRNLLIYLNSHLQKRLFPIFHYTLKVDGLLMLGPSETIGGFQSLFDMVDKKWKLFRRKETAVAQMLPAIPAQPVKERGTRVPLGTFTPPARPVNISSELEKLLLGRFAPPSVIVNDRGDIIYIHGRTGAYLEPPIGSPSINIHSMAREGLQIELAAAMRQALSHDGDVVRQHIRVKTNGDYEYVDVSVSKITEPESVKGLLMVSFQLTPLPQPIEPSPGKKGHKAVRASTERVQELEQEVLYTRESLQTTVEELETSNEELKSTNEELQSTNEELQSTNEELETSKEEMQSLNEELTTVNAELQSKVDDLSRANDDMQNLLNSTHIATIFLDNDLRIKRYTEQARKLIKLIPGDIGRPLGDLASELRYSDLASDAEEVLTTLSRKEREVQTRDSGWFLMRMMPYRTAGNLIDGVVITFVDIDATKQAEEAGRVLLLQSIFDTLRDPALVLDSDLRVVKANATFCHTFHTDLKRTERHLVYDIGGGEWDVHKLRELLEQIIPRKSAFQDFDVPVTIPEIGKRVFRLNARKLERETGLPGLILLVMADITDED
ncbi:MAG: PAS domain-containing protein [Verrucomicrobia bacterium]|jgi:two-component system, chemotaxis family, CheB/CheR fusion protein|nr:PAS domain-containing protein [Verrucomicrobiota bacterium]